MRSIDPSKIKSASRELGVAALDAAQWPDVMEALCRATGSTGAVLLQSDVRTADVPRTAGVHEAISAYFAEGWQNRDLRARGVPLWAAGQPVVIDQDIIDPSEKAAHFFYNECLLPFHFRWFAGIAFSAGSSLWVCAIQRTEREGPFEDEDKRVLAGLSPLLTEAATISTAVGRTVISGIADALGAVQQPALLLDRMGFVLRSNAAADRMFDDEIRVRNRRLVLRDAAAGAGLAKLIDRLGSSHDAADFPHAMILARRERGAAVLIRLLPIPPAARGPFLGARTMLTLTALEPPAPPDSALIAQVFGLTRAEARLAALIAGGSSPAEVAKRLGISRETARNHLKAVFAKTETHRQAELAALLSRFT